MTEELVNLFHNMTYKAKSVTAAVIYTDDGSQWRVDWTTGEYIVTQTKEPTSSNRRDIASMGPCREVRPYFVADTRVL